MLDREPNIYPISFDDLDVYGVAKAHEAQI